MNTYQRILGGLIGIAYGDSFGMPSEMWTREKIKEYFGEIIDFMPGPPENKISNKLVRGEVTDDTINTIFVVEMLSETNGEVDPKLFIDKLRHWSKTCTKSIAVTGPSTAKAFKELDAGVPIEETGKDGITNGAAMKILPVGFIADDMNLDSLIEQVHLLCMPTHNTSAAISGASAIAAAGAYAVLGKNDINEMLDAACKAAILGSKKGYRVSSATIEKRILLGKVIVDNSGNENEAMQAIYDLLGCSVLITESVPAALSLVYLSKGDPILCARYCANIGGDTDTIGAMACGICGALSGGEVFTEETIDLLEKVNKLSFHTLTDMLARIHKI